MLDFAHMHATSDGAFLEARPFAEALELVDAVLDPEAPFHIHFSDIAFANRNETKHLPYGEGTLRADPLRDALAGFERPATVISESPDEESSQAIRSVLTSVRRSELREPRFVDLRVAIPPSAAEEPLQVLERMELEELEPRTPWQGLSPTGTVPPPHRRVPERRG